MTPGKKIVYLHQTGKSDSTIGKQVGVKKSIVRKWRQNDHEKQKAVSKNPRTMEGPDE